MALSTKVLSGMALWLSVGGTTEDTTAITTQKRFTTRADTGPRPQEVPEEGNRWEDVPAERVMRLRVEGDTGLRAAVTNDRHSALNGMT
jgi:hypothetical protein